MEQLPYFKIFFWAMITYGLGIILKPAALVARDYLVWKAIALYVHKSKFNQRVWSYADTLAELKKIDMKGKPSANLVEKTYRHGEEEISAAEFASLFSRTKKLDNECQQLGYRLNMEVGIVGSIFKHYGQEVENPLREKVKKAKEATFREKGLPYD